ncbi:MAG: PqqD family protein [Clostridia bacterium]|nr:PqqD family protein [Clostridia bacterium]
MTRYRAAQGYVLREWDGEYLLIPVKLSGGKKPQMAILNPCGGFLWEALQEDRSFDELLRLLTDEYEVSTDQAERDIREFLDILDGFELLLRSEA